MFWAQTNIGWDSFTEGIIAKEWAIQQQQYYNSITECRRSGKSWALGLIHQIWIMKYNIWIHRNKVLHENQHIHNSLHGMEELERSIRMEYTKGIDNLGPAFSFMFTKYTLETLMNASPETKKRVV